MVMKRSLPVDTTEGSEDGDTDMDDTEMPEMGEEKEPTPKKIRRDLTKEAEEDLPNYDTMVNDPDVKFTEKLSKLSFYLQSVLDNNVNTLEFERNFNDWVKSSLLTLLGEGTVASVELYEFLCNVLKVAPTIVEPVCEKVLSFIFSRHHFSPEGNLAFENFMENLSFTFEKLRRFPKLIAKLLCCVRDSANGSDEYGGPSGARKFMKKMLGYKSKDKGLFILPKKFMDSYASVVGMLSVGQVVDLWKMLHHNLEEECIKKYNASNAIPVTCFLSVVVDLAVTFLCSIKVVDYSVPASTVERVVEMMDKLKQNCISKLAILLPSEYDTAFTRSFLKLSSAWCHLHHFMSIYNENYTKTLADSVDDFQQAVDLSFLIPQLSSEDWLSLWAQADKNCDDISASLMVSLVALKLKCFGMIQQSSKTINVGGENHALKLENECTGAHIDENNFLQRNMEEAAKFLWNHQQVLKLEEGSSFITSQEDTLRIATVYLQQDEMIEYAKTLLENTLGSTQSESNDLNIQNFQQQISSNMKFRVAVVLESLRECVKRIGKGNMMKRPVKKFLSECLNPAFEIKILKGLDLNNNAATLDEELKTSMMGAVTIINDVIKDLSIQDTDEQISAALLKEAITLVSNEELMQYPKTVKTIIFLSSLLIFTALIRYCKDYQETMDEVISVLSECGRNSQGNDVIFHIKWTELFGLVKKNSNLLSDSGIKSLCSLMLESIYMSPKIANEFGNSHIKSIFEDDNFDLVSTDGYLTVCVLDHILHEAIGVKSKSASVLASHAKELCTVIVNKLSDGSIITDLHSLIKKNKRKSLSTSTKNAKLPSIYVARVICSCNLLLKGKSFMSPEDGIEIAVIILPYMNFAVDYLELHSKKSVECKDDSILALLNCIQFLLEAIKAFQEYREKLPQDYLLRAWNSACTLDNCNNDEIKRKSEGELPKLILEVSDEMEFQSICDSIMEKMDRGEKSTLTARALSSLINAEFSNETKKQKRRSTIELGLYKTLEQVNAWKTSDDFMQLAVPYLNFQTSLLKRRKPMGSLSTLSICMSTITSLPLDKIEAIDSFKTAFLLVCDLLNALLFHRLDVISFRSHVFVQCFQFLVEALVKRADQRNKLTDSEIYYLRQCSHCIERVCQSAKLGREELSRVSPYLVVVLLRQFEKTTVYPIVKNPLLNGCYKLLDMCDDQGVSHVNSMLSTGSREIFKAVYELYKKFYRYKGKV